MAEFSNQVVKSFRASASIPAFVVVAPAATNAAVEVATHATATVMIVGVSLHAASTGGAISVAIGGTARVSANASISAGALLGVLTATGFVIEASSTFGLLAASLTNATINRTLGLALSNASTNGTVQVLLNPNNSRIAFT